jgi:hypothetical protein
MSNPYESPQKFGYEGGDGVNRAAAEAKVKPPALTLLIVMAVMMLFVVLGIVLNLAGVGLGAAAGGDEGMQAMFQGTFGLIQGAVGLLFGGVIIYGSLQMMKLQSWGLALAACIMAMLPFFSPCCCLGLPIGIWGLVVLNDPVVKAAFR